METDWLEILKERFEMASVSEPDVLGVRKMQVELAHFRNLMETLFRDKTFWFDNLLCISGQHFPAKNQMMVHYSLESLPHHQKIMVTCVLDLPALPELPEIPSVSDLWMTANWHERETAELYGIRFLNHPDLRNLLLPSDWVGFPMRKDYQPEDRYHTVQIRF
jgi:NADH-quinone oxidoreductase subunit C